MKTVQEIKIDKLAYEVFSAPKEEKLILTSKWKLDLIKKVVAERQKTT
jgi:hypothetical protein